MIEEVVEGKDCGKVVEKNGEGEFDPIAVLGSKAGFCELLLKKKKKDWPPWISKSPWASINTKMTCF
jgi:hypothetical protein